MVAVAFLVVGSFFHSVAGASVDGTSKHIMKVAAERDPKGAADVRTGRESVLRVARKFAVEVNTGAILPSRFVP